MPEIKRPSEDDLALVPSKKARNELVASLDYDRAGQVLAVEDGPPRTSNLLAPIMLLTGHQGEIFSCKFHPEGNFLASAGFERTIFLWNTYGECDNFAVLTGHHGAVLDMHFNAEGDRLFTASSDKNLAMWDINTGARIKRYKGHASIVNSCYPARNSHMLCSGSDDCSVRLWDTRKKADINKFDNGYQVTAVTFNEAADVIISGGIDNELKVWDLRKNALLYSMKGHTDTVTGLSLSPDGAYVLSNAMDNTLRVWDIRPFAPAERCLKVFTGHQHNFEKNLLHCAWSPDGSKVSAGSADRFVNIWDTTSRNLLYKLPGHNGSVNDVVFHPVEPVVASVSSDKKIYLGEIEP